MVQTIQRFVQKWVGGAYLYALTSHAGHLYAVGSHDNAIYDVLSGEMLPCGTAFEVRGIASHRADLYAISPLGLFSWNEMNFALVGEGRFGVQESDAYGLASDSVDLYTLGSNQILYAVNPSTGLTTPSCSVGNFDPGLVKNSVVSLVFHNSQLHAAVDRVLVILDHENAEDGELKVIKYVPNLPYDITGLASFDGKLYFIERPGNTLYHVADNEFIPVH